MVLFFVVFVFAFFLFTFKFLEVPPGIETDEGSIAYNAALIAKNLRDQNNRFMPVFILSTDRIDWKQPVLVYSAAACFRIFGTSLAIFKQVSLIYSLASLVIMWMLLRTMFSDKFSVAGTLVLITSPMMIVATRITTEAIIPLFFASAWLLFVNLYRRRDKPKYLFFSALALGISIYSYKGMRLVALPWIGLTCFFIIWRSLQKSEVFKCTTVKSGLLKLRKAIIDNSFLTSMAIFVFTIAPFFAVMPLLESKYPGAVFDRKELRIESYRHLSFYWLSNLNPGFLFGQGESGKIFQVELYGTFLISTLPFFLNGLKKSFEKISFFTFISALFLTTPLFYGMAGSFGIGHRLIAIVPLFVVITTLGIQEYALWVKKRVYQKNVVSKLTAISSSVVFLTFFIFNFLDFFKYYYFDFPASHEARSSFSNNLNKAFYELAVETKTHNLTPYIQDDIYSLHGDGNKFFEAAYFDRPLNMWKLGDKLPQSSAVLTQSDSVEKTVDTEIEVYPLHILSTIEN